MQLIVGLTCVRGMLSSDSGIAPLEHDGMQIFVVVLVVGRTKQFVAEFGTPPKKEKNK